MTSQPSQPTKEKRGLTSARRRRRILLFVAALRQLQQGEFSDLYNDIQDDIDAHVRQAERTRNDDCQDVINALREWQDSGLMVDEIMDETGLSERTVRGVLEDLEKIDPPIVGVSERRQVSGPGKPSTFYVLLK